MERPHHASSDFFDIKNFDAENPQWGCAAFGTTEELGVIGAWVPKEDKVLLSTILSVSLWILPNIITITLSYQYRQYLIS